MVYSRRKGRCRTWNGEAALLLDRRSGLVITNHVDEKRFCRIAGVFRYIYNIYILNTGLSIHVSPNESCPNDGRGKY